MSMVKYRYYLNGIFKVDKDVYKISVPTPYLQETKSEAATVNKSIFCEFIFYKGFNDIVIAIYPSEKAFVLKKSGQKYCFEEIINNPIYHYDSDLFYKDGGMIEKLNDDYEGDVFTRSDINPQKDICFKELLSCLITDNNKPIRIKYVSCNINEIDF